MNWTEVCSWFKRRWPLLGIAAGLILVAGVLFCFEGTWIPSKQVINEVPRLIERKLRDNDLYVPFIPDIEDNCVSVNIVPTGPLLLVRGYLSHNNTRFPTVTVLKKVPLLPFYIEVSTYVYDSDAAPLDWVGQFRYLIFQYDLRMNVVTDKVQSNVTAYMPVYGWVMLAAIVANLYLGEPRGRFFWHNK